MNTEEIIAANVAIDIAAGIIREHEITGMRPFDASRGGDLNIEFKRARSVSCDLYVRFTTGERREVHSGRGRNREIVGHVWVQRPIVEVCWSSTGRNVAAATAALALYREVTELAALIESALSEHTVAWREPVAAESTEGAAASGDAAGRTA